MGMKTITSYFFFVVSLRTDEEYFYVPEYIIIIHYNTSMSPQKDKAKDKRPNPRTQCATVSLGFKVYEPKY